MGNLSDVIVSFDNVTLDENVFLDKILTNDLIYDIIFNFSSPVSFLRLSRTCQQARAAVKSYMKRAYNINRRLSRFFPDPNSFRSLQARTNTVISGSTALQYFDRTFYPESDLDIYVPMPHKEEVGRFLLNAGYTFSPNTHQDSNFNVALKDPLIEANYGSYSMRGVAVVFTFVKPSPVDPSKELKVQAIVSVNTPMEIILLFHSTCVINIITHDTAYCLYPLGTLEQRRSLICRANGPNQEQAHEKYAARGFEMVPRLQQRSEDLHAFHEAERRWLGDSRCWTMSLSLEDVVTAPPLTPRSTPLSTNPIVASSWALGSLPSLGETEISFKVVESPSLLLYKYVYCDPRLLHDVTVMIKKQDVTFSSDVLPFKERCFFDEEYVRVAKKFFSRTYKL